VADDEVQAKAVLTEMQVRLSHGPHEALGLQDVSATPEGVRAAFLTLTKQFHPARFGRMSNELQRLSNEVFLGIKAAHESVLRSLGVVARGGRMNQTSQITGVMPVLTAEGTNKTARLGSPQPRAIGTQPQQPQPAIPRTLTPTRHGVGLQGKSNTPPFGVRVTAARPGTPPQTTPQPTTPRPGTPPQRPVTPQSSSRASTPNLTGPPKPVTLDPETTRGTGEWQQLAKPTAVFDERAELQLVLDALTQKNWGAAKALLNGLAARVPTSKKYRALIAYTRGREAQAASRGEDAAQEFQRALQLDPDLQQAKSALAELLRRR
jgi:hypothetical protein